jgi:hypothetical protein
MIDQYQNIRLQDGRCIGAIQGRTASFTCKPFWVERNSFGIDDEIMPELISFGVVDCEFTYVDKSGVSRVWRCELSSFERGNRISFRPRIYGDNVKLNQTLVSSDDMTQIEGPPLKNKVKSTLNEKQAKLFEAK